MNDETGCGKLDRWLTHQSGIEGVCDTLKSGYAQNIVKLTTK